MSVNCNCFIISKTSHTFTNPGENVYKSRICSYFCFDHFGVLNLWNFHPLTTSQLFGLLNFVNSQSPKREQTCYVGCHRCMGR